VAILLYVLGRYVLEGGSVPGFPFLASIIALFSGVQLFVIGIFGEYLARMHFRLMDRPAYTVEVDTASPEPNESPDGDELDCLACAVSWNGTAILRLVRVARAQVSRLGRTRHPRSWMVCRANAIDCSISWPIQVDSPPSVGECHGFRLVDLRVTLDRTLQVPAHAPQYAVRTAQPGDLPALRAMARAGFRQSRFYADPHIPAGRAGALYEIWVDKRLNDPTSRVLVVDTDGEAAGFITCLFDGADGAIDLFSVGEAARGRGIGQALVQGALAWFGEQGAQRASVVTQGRNIAGLRLYQRCGFVTRAVQLWYHRWFAHDHPADS